MYQIGDQVLVIKLTNITDRTGLCGDFTISTDLTSSKLFQRTENALEIYTVDENKAGVYHFHWNASLS